jgi:hypothetical protein
MKELLTKCKTDQSAPADDAAGRAEEGFWRRRIARADAALDTVIQHIASLTA